MITGCPFVGHSLAHTLREPEEIGDMVRVGFLWRPGPAKAQWIFRQELYSRSFPRESQFVSVYRPRNATA